MDFKMYFFSYFGYLKSIKKIGTQQKDNILMV